MLPKIISFTCLLLLSSFSFADEHAKEVNLRYETSFWSTKIFNGDKLLGSRKAQKSHLSSDPIALAEFNRSNGSYIGASIFTYVGAFAIGGALGSAAGSDESVDTGIVAGGVVAGAVAIFLAKKSNAYVRSSIDIFNANSTTALSNDASQLRKVKFRLNLTPSRLGISMFF